MKIPVLHLENGTHYFEEMNALQGYPELFDARHIRNVMAFAEVNRNNQTLQVRVDMTAEMAPLCDRCLEPYQAQQQDHFELLLRVGIDEPNHDEEDVLYVEPETVELDISHRLAEQLVLAQPMKNLCRESCKGMCDGCGRNLNDTDQNCSCHEKTIDPRWEKLKHLLEAE